MVGILIAEWIFFNKYFIAILLLEWYWWSDLGKNTLVETVILHYFFHELRAFSVKTLDHTVLHEIINIADLDLLITF